MDKSTGQHNTAKPQTGDAIVAASWVAASVASPKALANLFLIGGAVLFAVAPAFAQKWWLFLFFLTGHLIWTTHGLRIRDNELIILNGAMILLDLYAITIRV